MLTELDASMVDDQFKGVPAGTPAFALAAIGRHGWNVLREDLPLPLAVLKLSALDHNAAWMRRFLSLAAVDIAPHGKTSMSPQLFHRQLADGAWGITISTAHQLRVCRKYGVSRVIYANQLVGRQAIHYVLDEIARDPSFDFYCLVDSLDGVRILHEQARGRGVTRPVQVLVEVGFPNGRTGCRTVAEGLAVARAVHAAEPYLALRGVEGFEGIIQLGPNGYDDTDRVDRFLQQLVALATACAAEDLFAAGEVILSAGGSAYFDKVAKQLGAAVLGRPTRVVLRSGCYLTHDARMYQDAFEAICQRSEEARNASALGPGLREAFEVWGYVQSMPEAGRAILTVGKRDCSYDYRPPEPQHWFRPGTHELPVPLTGHTVIQQNDQHAYVQYSGQSPLRVGDMVALGISHPCTTFDKWQLICVVDDRYDVVSAVRTFF